MSHRSDDSWSLGRRAALKLTAGLALTSAPAGTAIAGGRDRVERTCYVEQGDRAYEIEPLRGDVPVEELYDYRLPDEYEGVGVTTGEGPHYRSVGTKDLQAESTTVTFLYDGPDGLSVVVVHGRPGGEGGSVSWTIESVPRDAEWAVQDDYYVDADTGEIASNNYDRWETEGTEHSVDWTWGSHGTDGGALSDLGETFSLTIRPAFNEDAELYGEHYSGQVDEWWFLSGDRGRPDGAPLELDEPVRVACERTKRERSRKRDDERKHRHDGERRKHSRDRDDRRGKRHGDDGTRDGKRRGGYQRQRQSQEQRQSGGHQTQKQSQAQRQSGGGTQAQSQSQSQTQVQTGDGTRVQRQNQSQTQTQGLLDAVLGGDD